jgi:hypothetical protein
MKLALKTTQCRHADLQESGGKKIHVKDVLLSTFTWMGYNVIVCKCKKLVCCRSFSKIVYE